jgi:hypothetical protein
MATPFRLGVLALVSLLLVGSLRAQQAESEAQYPTVAALENAVIPRRDRIQLAQRILGVRELAAPPLSAPERQIGEQETFWVSDLTADQTFQVSATLRVAGEHIYLWVEDGIPVTDADLRALADAFDSRIYESVRDVWGNEDAPGSDGDPRIYGLFARGIGLSTLAYFTTQHVYPAEVVPPSNQHAMFVFNADALDGSLLDLASTTAHEFQHDPP